MTGRDANGAGVKGSDKRANGLLEIQEACQWENDQE